MPRDEKPSPDPRAPADPASATPPLDPATDPVPAQAAVASIRDPERLQALCHPTRVQMLAVLREPRSAAAVARELGQPRQRIGHHLRTLEEARLVAPVARRISGNFVEVLYRSVARSFVVSPEVTWADARRSDALQAQHSLRTLVSLGERLQTDAVILLDRAAYEGERVPSAGVDAQVRFASESDREAFLTEYLEAMRALLERHASSEGDPYRVVLAVHPETRGTVQ